MLRDEGHRWGLGRDAHAMNFYSHIHPPKKSKKEKVPALWRRDWKREKKKMNDLNTKSGNFLTRAANCATFHSGDWWSYSFCALTSGRHYSPPWGSNYPIKTPRAYPQTLFPHLCYTFTPPSALTFILPTPSRKSPPSRQSSSPYDLSGIDN